MGARDPLRPQGPRRGSQLRPLGAVARTEGRDLRRRARRSAPGRRRGPYGSAGGRRPAAIVAERARRPRRAARDRADAARCPGRHRRRRQRPQRRRARGANPRGPVSEVVELAAQLVAIDSVNPALVPGGAGEAEAARFVAEWFERAGLDVEVVDEENARPSVIATARGRGGGATLLLNGHLDTVGLTGMNEPLTPRVADGRLYGRGAYDMKGAVAAM